MNFHILITYEFFKISIKFINKDINYGIFGRKSVVKSCHQILQILDNQISPSFFPPTMKRFRSLIYFSFKIYLLSFICRVLLLYMKGGHLISKNIDSYSLSTWLCSHNSDNYKRYVTGKRGYWLILNKVNTV